MLFKNHYCVDKNVSIMEMDRTKRLMPYGDYHKLNHHLPHY